MIDKRTVFILGAGASKPYGYPTGIKLRQSIIEEFKRIIGQLPDDDWGDYLPDSTMAEQFINKFDRSDTDSIDLFLSRHSSDKELMSIGKKAISSIILNCENSSRFNNALYDSREEDWYNYLCTRMTETMRSDVDLDFSKNQVSFITFNYDRSLEFYFHQALTNSFGELHRKLLEDELRKIEIIHVHGCVARLPWENETNTFTLKYRNPKLRSEFIIRAAKQIKIVGEMDEDENITKAQDLLKDTERIFFLGFGFASENLMTLDIPNSLASAAHIYGTVRGFEEREIEAIRNYFGWFTKRYDRLILEPMDSRSLLRKYL